MRYAPGKARARLGAIGIALGLCAGSSAGAGTNSGPIALTRTIETGSSDRIDNMRVFGVTLLEMLVEALQAAPPRNP